MTSYLWVILLLVSPQGSSADGPFRCLKGRGADARSEPYPLPAEPGDIRCSTTFLYTDDGQVEVVYDFDKDDITDQTVDYCHILMSSSKCYCYQENCNGILSRFYNDISRQVGALSEPFYLAILALTQGSRATTQEIRDETEKSDVEEDATSRTPSTALPTTTTTTSTSTTSPSTTSTTASTTFTSTSTTTGTTTTMPEQLTCWTSDLSEDSKNKANSVCFIDYAMINSKCELRGKGIDMKDNVTTGCRTLEYQNKSILRCTCVVNGCNKHLDGMWKRVESNNQEHMKLNDCVDRLVHGETLPTSGTSTDAPSTTSLSQTEDAKSSLYVGLFIGLAAFNLLTVVIILVLIVALVKMKKKGAEAKRGTTKKEQKAHMTPTAIQIENPVLIKEPANVAPPASATKAANQPDEVADQTTTTGTLDLDTTGGTTDSDSTGTEGPSEVRVTVRGFNRD